MPQNKVLQWMLVEDFQQPSITRKRIGQQYIILLLYSVLVEEELSANVNTCNWSGIVCYTEKGFNDAIKEIKLRNSSLSGSLPFEIEELKGLQVLDFSMTKITGSLPETMGNMLMPKSINIGSNSVMRTIPTIFGLLT